MALQVKSDLEKSGFVVNNKKSVWTPVQIMEWLGFNWNLKEGTLEVPVKKIENLKNIISALFECNIHITCRNLAKVCGKIISMLPALGSICQIMTRHLHMTICCRDYWDSFVYLNENVIQELRFLTQWKQFEKLANDSRFAKIVSALPSIVEASSSKSTVKKYKFYFGKFRIWCSDCQLEFSPATSTTTHMAHYTGFDETCDSSALLGLLLNIAKFDPIVQSDADDVRRHIRNPWAHCNFAEWDALKFSSSFQLMKKLVKDLKLTLNEETIVIDEMDKWEMNGQRFLSGTTHGLGLVNELRQQTHALAVYTKLVATETYDNCMRVIEVLDKFKINILEKLVQLDKDMKTGFLEIDKKLKSQDKTNDTQIDSHEVDIECWKEQDVLFVGTPVVKAVSDILELKPTVLIVGESGIGKSMLMHHIALKLHDKIEYSLIPCYEIQDIIRHYKKNISQMFVLDDICGRFTVSFGDIEYLVKNEVTLKRLLERGKTKIAATCRLDIYRDEKFHAFCSVITSSIFNLSAIYSKEDKLKICAKYLNKDNIQLLTNQHEPFTPLMCSLYSKYEHFNLTDFFHCPYDTFRNEWEKLQSIDPYKYCALFLCVIHNGIVNESVFDIDTENININQKDFKNIFDICGVDQAACNGENDDIVQLLIDKGCDVSQVDGMLDTSLTAACKRGYTKIVQLLIDNGGDINQVNGMLETPLTSACSYGNDEILQFLLSKGCIVNQVDGMGKTPLMAACRREHEKTAQLLIDKGSDVNQITKMRETALTESCRRGNEKIVQLLIDKGGGVNQVDGLRETPLTAACKRENQKIVQLLINSGGDINQCDDIGDTPLKAACEIGNDKMIQLLIDKGGCVNQMDGFRETPLTAACKRGNEKIVQLIIDNDGDINQADGMGRTPLTVACMGEHVNIVQLLIKKGGNINQVDNISETLIIAACGRGNEEIVQLLIDNGADLKKINGISETPVTAACKRGNEKILSLLIDNGCSVNKMNGMKRTPLTVACQSEDEKMVQLIIDKGGDVNQVDGMRDSPLTVACERKNYKIVQLLIDNGCYVNQVNGMRETPMTAAC
ncbi:uncharacterized protein [Mytilus edulis]|uniref:uncharacterized protein n=1 Tax=Mytilus edulis TaxID=6550 RepID=UPI0039EF040D